MLLAYLLSKVWKGDKNFAVKLLGVFFLVAALGAVADRYSPSKATALSAQENALSKQNDPVVDAFWKSYIGQHIYQNETFSSPEIAAKSLVEIKDYCGKEAVYISREDAILDQFRQLTHDANQNRDVTDVYQAGQVWCSAATDFYSYAADPTHEIHIVNGKAVIVGAAKFNELGHSVNVAKAKLDVVSDIFDQKQALLKK
jgi:hypothetical protein